MADRTQLKVAENDQLSSDDPFAELTRIMGFDPRESGRSQSEAEQASAEVLGDDFGIDLEKELLGAFSLDEAGDQADASHHFEAVPHVEAQEATHAAYAPASPVQEQDAYAYSVEETQYDFAEPEHRFEPAQVASEAYQVEAPGYHDQVSGYEAASYASASYQYEPQVAVEYEGGMADFDHQVAAELEGNLATHGEWSPDFAEEDFSAPDHASSEDERYLEAPQERVAGYGYSDEVSVAAEAHAVSYDAAQPVALDDGFELSEAHWSVAEEVAPFAEQPIEDLSAVEPVAAYQPDYTDQASADLATSTSVEDFDEDFDAALAEVDMDFTAVPLKSFHQPAPEQPSFADEPQFVAAATEAAEPSLEDELNALLGNLSSPHQPAMDEPVAVEAVEEQPAYDAYDAYEAEPDFDVDLNLSDEDFLTEAASPQFEEPAAAPQEMAPAAIARSEYVYSRGNYRIEPSEPSYAARTEEAYTPPVADAYVPEPDPVDAEPELSLDFDDAAFSQAFANSFEEPTSEDYGDEQPAEEQLDAEDASSEAKLDDPYAELAALTASFSSASAATPSWDEEASTPADEPATHYGEADELASMQSSAPAFEDVPDIETVDVPEQAVALADDLDLPELVFEEDVPAVSNYDDLDAEFANLLNDMSSPEPATKAPAQPAAKSEEEFAADFEREFQIESEDYAADSTYPAAAAAAAGVAAAAVASAAYSPTANNAYAVGDFSDAGQNRFQSSSDYLNYDADLDDETGSPAAQERKQPQRRGVLLAAVIGGVVVLGGVGAYALSGGGAGSGAPAIITADESPIKMRPENPGGTSVPNQESKVYETVARSDADSEPTQQRLLTTAEQPIDMVAQQAPLDEEETFVGEEPADQPVGKSEDRITQVIEDAGAGQNMEVAAVAPRKVRTMVVRPDGTLVPREEEPAPAQVVDPAPAAPVGAAAEAPESPAVSAPGATPAVPEQAPAAAAQAPAAEPSATPQTVAVAPSRPSDQPVNVVGEVKPDQVALNAASAGEWAMQIASQPTEAAAQSSYQDLLRRYGNVLNGHPANIVKAEIAGKGTFYRVRVPAATRNDAIALCESYKAAGGNCFVSK